MKRLTVVAAAVAVTLVATTAVFAGGEKCRKAAQVKQAKGDCATSAEECLSAMAVKIRTKGWLGIETEKDNYGKYEVVSVDQGSPADQAGFRSGDVLVAINGASLYAEDKSELKAVKQGLGIGSEVTYTVKRAGSKAKLTATLAEVPPSVMAQWIGEHMLDQHAHIEVASS